MEDTCEVTKPNYFDCPRLDQPPRIVTLDPDGDLHLIVGRNTCLLSSCNWSDKFRPIQRFRLNVTKDRDGELVFQQIHFLSTASDFGSDSRDEADISTNAMSEQEPNTSEKASQREYGSTRTVNEFQSHFKDKRFQTHKHSKAIEYIVCSKTLSRASLFFKRLLYGEFAESKKPEGNSQWAQWTVYLPEDHPTALGIILGLAHGVFRDIPFGEFMGTEALYKITILTDKYDMTQLLRPFARGWIEAKPVGHYQESTNASSDSKLSWAAWELGHSLIFKRLIDTMARNASLDALGRLVYTEMDTLSNTQVLFHDHRESSDIVSPPKIIGK